MSEPSGEPPEQTPWHRPPSQSRLPPPWHELPDAERTRPIAWAWAGFLAPFVVLAAFIALTAEPVGPVRAVVYAVPVAVGAGFVCAMLRSYGPMALRAFGHGALISALTLTIVGAAALVILVPVCLSMITER